MKWYNFLILMCFLSIAVYFLFIHKGCRKQQGVVTTTDSVQHTKTTDGKDVAYVRKLESDYAIKTKQLDSIARLLRTKPKFIKEYVTIYQKTIDTIYGKGEVKIITDTSGKITALNEIFADPYYTIDATITTDGYGSVVHLQGYDTLTVVTREIKEGPLFNKKSFIEIDVMNTNPHVIVEGIKTYRVRTAKPKRFGIGFHVGYGIGTDMKFRPVASLGINYSLIRF